VQKGRRPRKKEDSQIRYKKEEDIVQISEREKMRRLLTRKEGIMQPKKNKRFLLEKDEKETDATVSGILPSKGEG